jgi:hypothetical protein
MICPLRTDVDADEPTEVKYLESLPKKFTGTQIEVYTLSQKQYGHVLLDIVYNVKETLYKRSLSLLCLHIMWFRATRIDQYSWVKYHEAVSSTLREFNVREYYEATSDGYLENFIKKQPDTLQPYLEIIAAMTYRL